VAGSSSGLVEIVREYLTVDPSVRRLIQHYRCGELGFEEVGALFAGDEASALFRLKERCHALFRADPKDPTAALHRAVLLDLAVGSLFHEAMKFREIFYQREVYGPRVRALRDEAGEEAVALFQEFEKILATGTESLELSLLETEALLDRTREQLAVLLAAHPEDGHVVRFLIEHRTEVEAVFGRELEALLADIHGDAASGYALAGYSYLKSGYYEDAERTLYRAVRLGGEATALEAGRAYARGMAAYLDGRYAESVAQLERWAVDGSSPELHLLDLAQTALSKLDQLVTGEDRGRVIAAAAKLVERVTAMRAAARPAEAAG
jgi:tetratricopeptide (TPR) repeat protein